MKEIVCNKIVDKRLQGKIIANLFYEPSTRTSSSFYAAMIKLGGSVMTINEQSSSIAKGESLYDTIRTLATYCDAIVLRHPLKWSSNIAKEYSKVPIINAGDGIGEHPTQALLDLLTIDSELGRIGSNDGFNPMVITFVGDLKHG